MDDIHIILPIYNERDIIPGVLQEWSRVLSGMGVRYTFVICEDGSTDGTKTVLKDLLSQHPIILSQREMRRGYGGAVIDGILASSATYVLCIDSDGQCDPQDIHRFWEARDESDVIIGWRTHRADTWIRKVFSRLFFGAFALFFPVSIHDPSAPYVLFKREKILPYVAYLKYLREGFWWGFVGMCVKKRLSVRELPIHHRTRLKGDTQVYHLRKIPEIAVRNLRGLLALKMAR